MSRYLLTDEAKQDLAGIRRYLVREAGTRIAKSTLTKIKDAFVFLSRTPGAGHVREDLTSDPPSATGDTRVAVVRVEPVTSVKI